MKKKISLVLAVLLVFSMIVPIGIVFAASGRNPFEMINAAECDSLSGGKLKVVDTRVGESYNGAWICFKNLDFDIMEAESVELYIAVTAEYCDNQVTKVKLDSPTGDTVAEIAVQPSGWTTPLKHKAYLSKKIKGKHDVYLVWGGLSTIYKFKFNTKFTDKSGYIEYTNEATYSDINNNPHRFEIEMVTQLGLLDKYSDTEYNWQLPVTRGEFSETVFKTVSDGFGGETADFSDVDKDDKCYEAVAALTKMGIVNGYPDNDFRLDEFISVTDASVFLCKMLGFKDAAEAKGGYPSGYLLVAKQEGILDGVDVSEILTREMFAKIIYNAVKADYLDFNSIKNDKVTYKRVQGILSKTKGLSYGEGLVTQNGQTSIYSAQQEIKSDKVRIGDEVYSSGETKAVSYLGMQCEFFYDADDNNRIVAIYPVSEVEQTFITEGINSDLEKISESKLEYDVGGKSKTINFPQNTCFIYNGKAVDFDIEDNIDVKKFSGTIRVVENQDDSTVVFIDEYRNIVVSSVDASGMTIIDKISDDVIDLSDDDTMIICMRNGLVCDFSEIAVGDSARLYISRNKTGDKFVRIMCEEIQKSGTVTSTEKSGDDTLIEIDGKQYRAAKEYTQKIEPGQSGIFTLNAFDEIVYYSVDTENRGYMLGCIIDYSEDEENKKNILMIEVITEDNKDQILYCKDKVTLDGNKFKKFSEIDNWMKQVNMKTPVRYRLDDEGYVTMLDTYKDGIGGKDDELTMLSNNTESFVYRKEGNVLVADGVSKIPLTADAICISFWNNKEDKEATIGKMTAQEISRDSKPSGSAYSLKKDSITADLFVWEKRVSPSWSDAFIVDKVSKKVASDGEIEQFLKGYLNGSIVEYEIDSDAVNNNAELRAIFAGLKTGDIVRTKFAKDSKLGSCWVMYLYDGAVNRSVNINGTEMKIKPTLSSNSFSYGDAYLDEHLVIGKVEKISDKYIELISNSGDKKEVFNASTAAVVKVSDGRNGREIDSEMTLGGVKPGDAVAAWFINGRVKVIAIYD